MGKNISGFLCVFLVFVFAGVVINSFTTVSAEEDFFVRDAANKLSESQINELNKILKDFYEDYEYQVHVYISGRAYENEKKFREFGDFAFEYLNLDKNIPPDGKNYNMLVLYSENVGGKPVIYYVYDNNSGCDIFSSYIDRYIQSSDVLSANIESSDFNGIANNVIKAIKTIIKIAGYECRINLCDEINNGMDPRYPNYQCDTVGGTIVFRCYSNTGNLIYCYGGESYPPVVNKEVIPTSYDTTEPKNEDFSANTVSYYNIENSRNMYKYTDKTVFIVSDENWEDVISLLPITIWKGGNDICNSVFYDSEKCAYPLLIYHKETGSQDADSILDFLDQYDADYVRVVGRVPDYFKTEILKRVDEGSYLDTYNYLSFWYTRNKIVITERDYKTAMLAAVLASRENAPLVFSDDPDIYNIIRYTNVIVVGKNHGLEKEKFMNNNVNLIGYYTFEQLRDKMISETDKMILLNPNDINDEYCENIEFNPEHSPKISKIYCHDSLAAPYLAVAKDEAITFTDVEAFSYGIDGNEIDESTYIKNPDKLCDTRNKELDTKLTKNANEVKDDLYEQVNNFNYLTVISSPRGIPFSKKIACYSNGNRDVRYSFDKMFVDVNSDWVEDTPVGRIFGVTVSDTSSYIARDVFYKKIQPESAKNIMLIGHSFENHQKYLPVITLNAMDAGYEVECYISNHKYDTENVCWLQYRPPLYDYNDKNFILFGGHGLTSEWFSTFNVQNLRNIQKLSLPFVFVDACQTLNYYQSRSGDLLGVNFIRKGALAYVGNLGVSYNIPKGIPINIENIENIFQKDSTLGYSLFEINNKIYDNVRSVSYSYMIPERHYAMLGDPTIIPDKLVTFDLLREGVVV